MDASLRKAARRLEQRALDAIDGLELDEIAKRAEREQAEIDAHNEALLQGLLEEDLISKATYTQLAQRLRGQKRLLIARRGLARALGANIAPRAKLKVAKSADDIDAAVERVVAKARGLIYGSSSGHARRYDGERAALATKGAKGKRLTLRMPKGQQATA